jgi:hypothetical protein
MIFNFCEKILDVRCEKCSKLNKSCDSINRHLRDVVVSAHSKQISLVMYDFLNTLLLQRRTIFSIVTTVDATSINVQFVFFFSNFDVSLKQDREDSDFKKTQNEISSSVDRIKIWTASSSDHSSKYNDDIRVYWYFERLFLYVDVVFAVEWDI